MNTVERITEPVYRELESLLSQSAGIADQHDERGMDDCQAMMMTRRIRDAMTRVASVQMCSKWMTDYVRGTDMSTDMLMEELESLPGSFRDEVAALAAKLG